MGAHFPTSIKWHCLGGFGYSNLQIGKSGWVLRELPALTIAMAAPDASSCENFDEVMSVIHQSRCAQPID